MAKSVEPDGSREPEVVQGNPKSRQTDKDSIRGTHQGQRSYAPHQKAGHMTASDQTSSRKKTLANRGPSTHEPLPLFPPSLDFSPFVPHITPHIGYGCRSGWPRALECALLEERI